MMVRTQITMDREMQRKARRRASEKGISLAEYVRQVVAHDLGETRSTPDVSAIFNLGSSGGSNIAKDKDSMIAESVVASRRRFRKSA